MGRKIIVAVHGIGDQFYFETLQTVAQRVYEYYDSKGGFTISLGHLNSELKHSLDTRTTCNYPVEAPPDPKQGCYFPTFPDPILPPNETPGAQSQIGFAEVYWADLPRARLSSGYELEESKRWANGVVQRLRGFGKNDDGTSEIDYNLAAIVLAEMADTIAVLEWLFGFARKMKLFDFKLKKLLDDMLGDVQFVTEFTELRNQIMERFMSAMEGIELENDDEIYFISHSEGTVVAAMGLLSALSSEGSNRPEWVKQVRGLVTLGSPIDKHLILWPDIWMGFGNKAREDSNDAPEKGKRIKWWNYYDYGDPVGFELETARERLDEFGWNEHFDFQESQDIGFVRYGMPGAAHVEYWNDQPLFDQILQDVVGLEPKQPKAKVPTTKPKAKITSWVLPYIFAFLSLGAGTYALNMGMWAFQKQARFDDYSTFFYEVLGLTFLLAAVTVVSRIPRLAKKPIMRWWVAGGAFVVLCLLGRSIVPEEISEKLARLVHLQFLGSWFLPAVATVTAIVAWILSRSYPGLGMRPLLYAGGGAVLAFVILIVWKTESADPHAWTEWEKAHYQWEQDHPAPLAEKELAKVGLPPLPPRGHEDQWKEAVLEWNEERTTAVETGREPPPRPAAMPENGSILGVVLGVLAFFYLWRLAALLFDLTFVWHRYIQGGAMTTVLRHQAKAT